MAGMNYFGNFKIRGGQGDALVVAISSISYRILEMVKLRNNSWQAYSCANLHMGWAFIFESKNLKSLIYTKSVKHQLQFTSSGSRGYNSKVSFNYSWFAIHIK